MCLYLSELTAVPQGEIIAVGRICSDSEEKPNESSLLLESSRSVGDGKRVSLQFTPQCGLRSELPGRPAFNFFSGQIVALRGKNGNGLKFVVSEILSVRPSCLPGLNQSLTDDFTQPPRLLPQPHGDRSDVMDSESMLILTASGPFSSDRDLDYSPWVKLITAVQQAQPSVLVLVRLTLALEPNPTAQADKTEGS